MMPHPHMIIRVNLSLSNKRSQSM